MLSLAGQLKTVLFEVSPLDPVSLAFACGLVSLAGLIAAFVPVRVAARTDPVQGLRSP